MKFSSSLIAALVAGLSVATPIYDNTNVVKSPKVDDGIILNYALTLEFLERKFYQEALAKFTKHDFQKAGFADPFYKNLQEIYVDEKTHVDFIAGALTAAGVKPTNELKYKFGFETVQQFVTLSAVLEGVGVSAYLGAAASIADPGYLTAAGAILTVEARHNAYIRSQLKESPFPNPFDTPLDFNEVYSLAAAFIVGGSSPVTLPFKPFPKLALQCTECYYEAHKSPVTFKGAFVEAKKFDKTITAHTDIFAVFFSGLKKIPVKVSVTSNGKDYKIDKIPAGIQGQSYIVLSRSSTNFSDEFLIAGPAITEIYPKGKIPSTPLPKCP